MLCRPTNNIFIEYVYFVSGFPICGNPDSTHIASFVLFWFFITDLFTYFCPPFLHSFFLSFFLLFPLL